MGANIKLDTLSDVVRHKGNLLVECACGRRSIVDAERLSRWFMCHGWNTALRGVARHLKCSRCGKRANHTRATFGAPTGPMWGPVSEDDWKALVKRLRR